MDFEFLNRLLDLSVHDKVIFASYFVCFYAVTKYFDSLPSKTRNKKIYTIAFFSVGLAFLLDYIDENRNFDQSKNAFDSKILGKSENAFYIKFHPVATTISDGYFQIEFHELDTNGIKNVKCESNSVVVKQDDPRVENYLSMVLNAMNNKDVWIATRVKSKCEGESYSLENLIIEAKHKDKFLE